ncbi:Scd6-like Sm domain-containing protein [Aspergillus karnatakaensis]|uniref:putative G2/M phase checkpoint control protein Sum2 n=1 Tax=Aspergillus karnatakaensis TaxID=1810916 RepID=UPI003CCDA4A5
MDMNHLIGQRFNLISKSDIRYVGTLHEINPEASTIALQNVVSFGTEGRRGGTRAEEIPASNSVYEYIVFRGSDVKDISVAEDAKENEQPEPPQMPDDPAILGVSAPLNPLLPQSSPHPQLAAGVRSYDQMMNHFGCKHRPVLNCANNRVEISVAFLLIDHTLQNCPVTT